jgi:oxygen-independent coproporphyrinogen-3 oxidase
LHAALSWQPEEIYLYPLYVRPLTGLGRRLSPSDVDPAWDAQRMALYRQGRDLLRANGYEQLSMRSFRRSGSPTLALDYDCQDDGMVGLGCGARSYTRTLHYSFDYAVSVAGVRAVIDDYLNRDPVDFTVAQVGFTLDEAEQRRRWLVKTLLRATGVSIPDWRTRFGDEPPDLAELERRGWLERDDDRLCLTPEGLARSDAIGPWLVSAPVRTAMVEYELR